MLPDLSYSSATVSGIINVPIEPVVPTNSYYEEFSSNPTLPAGLQFGSNVFAVAVVNRDATEREIDFSAMLTLRAATADRACTRSLVSPSTARPSTPL